MRERDLLDHAWRAVLAALLPRFSTDAVASLHAACERAGPWYDPHASRDRPHVELTRHRVCGPVPGRDDTGPPGSLDPVGWLLWADQGEYGIRTCKDVRDAYAELEKTLGAELEPQKVTLEAFRLWWRFLGSPDSRRAELAQALWEELERRPPAAPQAPQAPQAGQATAAAAPKRTRRART